LTLTAAGWPVVTVRRGEIVMRDGVDASAFLV